MADAYWRYAESRQQPPPALHSLVGKRPRAEYDLPGGNELPGYYTHGDERAGTHRVIRDTDAIGASYDRYLRGAQLSSYGGGDSARPLSTGLSSRPIEDPRMIDIGAQDPMGTSKARPLGMGSGRSELPLPPDASSTLFVEGLPANCTRREVSHIFRPFVGYKEVRLVTKESRHSGGDPLVLCFVDFVSPAHAATAMDALQGYKFDEHDRDSASLRLQFARYPGARSGGGHRGKR
ncbi:RNA-binding protein 1-like [Diospyros lotus]|uniref:RNA-binding protein 1-like n=1 Tax=Diospyros lotus TaxID=55363 RepID=UPI002252DAD9|nr:RNA-binding protein 1-like [Diospyros lotus]